MKDYCMSLEGAKDIWQRANMENEMFQSRNTIYDDIDNMTKRYVIKLIPVARRIIMPKVRDMVDVVICYKEEEFNLNNTSLGANIVDLIREKTGILFSMEYDGYSFLLPNSLRELVNLIVVLLNMENPESDKEVYHRNIKSLYNCMSEYLKEAKQILFGDDVQVGNSISEINGMNFNANTYLEYIWEKNQKKDNLQRGFVSLSR